MVTNKHIGQCERSTISQTMYVYSITYLDRSTLTDENLIVFQNPEALRVGYVIFLPEITSCIDPCFGAYNLNEDIIL